MRNIDMNSKLRTNKFASLRNVKSKVVQIWIELDGELDGNWTAMDSVISTFVSILDFKA